MDYDLRQIESVTEQFGYVFRSALKKAYGEIPSAAFVAVQFNRRCLGTEAVSQESARRWIRGFSIPDPVRLSVLSSWLEIDYNAVFQSAKLRKGQDEVQMAKFATHGRESSPDETLCHAAVFRFVNQNKELILKILSTSASP
jgi:hypothetical protein